MGAALCAGVAAAQTPVQEDSINAELDKLRVQAHALQLQIQALQEKALKAQADRDTAEKYMREFAEACLDAILNQNQKAIGPLLSKEIKDFESGGHEKEVDRQRWIDGYVHNSLGLGSRGVWPSAYKITTVVVAPSLKEALFRGEFTGSTKQGDNHGKEKVATFALRIQKDKESGRYEIGFITVSLK
jgi:hypothetical protein